MSLLKPQARFSKQVLPARLIEGAIEPANESRRYSFERYVYSRAVLPMLEEHFFTCPYCWQSISMLLDLSAGEQTYVEDCEVCCRPILVHVVAEDGALVGFDASPETS